MNSDDVFRSANWAVHASSDLALSVMMRMASKKQSLELFDRVRIASFSEGQSLKLIERIENAIEYVLQEWDSTNVELQMGWNSELEFELKLLKRLSIRTPTERIANSLQTAVHLFEEMGERRPVNLVSPVVGLLGNLLQVASPKQVSEIVADLADLPLPNDFDLPSDFGLQWKEPLQVAVLAVGKARLSTQVSLSEKVQGIALKLASTARFGERHDREAAILRLSALHRIGALNEESMEAFTAAVWSWVDDEEGLPVHTGLNYRGLLSLPDPEEGSISERIRERLVTQDFPRATKQGEIEKGDQVGGRFPSPVRFYLNRWIQSTRSLGPNEESVLGLEWSTEEVSELLKQAYEWWQDEKLGLHLSNERMLGGGRFRELFGMLENLLTHVILPHLTQQENNKSVEKASTLLDEMRAENLPTLVAETELGCVNYVV